jgi:Fur family peroxide stress response transcriptional regulator
MKTEKREIERRLERFKAVAKEVGVKLTHQRLEIFREVASSLEHPDAETVFRAVQARIPTVSLDTVYRTLWTLNDLGLITTLGPRHERVRFDANLEHHYHYVCVHCGSAKDFESAELNTLRIPEAVKRFGSVVATCLEVRGICGRCAKKATRSATSTRRCPPCSRPRDAALKGEIGHEVKSRRK